MTSLVTGLVQAIGAILSELFYVILFLIFLIPSKQIMLENIGKSMGKAKKGDVLSIQTAGGGGYGDPKKRSPESIQRDIEDGKISIERAREVYGWQK